MQRDLLNIDRARRKTIRSDCYADACWRVPSAILDHATAIGKMLIWFCAEVLFSAWE